MGQPDTYLGEFWTTDECPSLSGDKHAKGGVQNHWFYLLSEGGWGTNDNGEVYTVFALGETIAARILYWSMTNEMMPSSQYSDAREGTIAAAIFYFGECSFEHNQVMNAWHAVGVGNASDCANASINNEKNLDDFNVYPNPIKDQFTISWDEANNFDLRVYSMSGQLLFTQQNLANNEIVTPPNIAKGTYIVEITNEDTTLRKKVIIE